jgi:hypothetical protein
MLKLGFALQLTRVRVDTQVRQSQPQLGSCFVGAFHIHRCRNASRSAVHESGDTPSFTTWRHFPRTPQISLCRPVSRFPPKAAFLEAIF